MKTQLLSIAQQLQLDLSDIHLKQLNDYLQLLHKWNQAYNLSAFKTIEEMLTLHIADSLAVVPHLTGQRIIDVGTGGGLPGMVLAIACPHQEFVLLDSSAKRVRFLVQSIYELGLNNVSAVHSRVEDYQPNPQFDVVVSRAFTALDNMVHLCRHLLLPTGAFLAMKGPRASVELESIHQAGMTSKIIDLDVPGLDHQRCLVDLTFNKDDS